MELVVHSLARPMGLAWGKERALEQGKVMGEETDRDDAGMVWEVEAVLELGLELIQEQPQTNYL